MDVARARRLWSVDICVGINPNDGDLTVKSLAYGFGGAADRADGNRVVAAQGQHEATLAGMAVDLVGNTAGDGRDGLGVLHAAVWRVAASLGHQVCVEVDGVVAMQLVAQLIAELGQQAGLDQGGGSSVNAWLALGGKVVLVGQSSSENG